MGINYNLAVDRLEGLNLYFYVFLSATSGSATGVKSAKGFTTAKTCSLLSRPSQSSDRGCHRGRAVGWDPNVALARASMAAALLEIPALPALRLAAAVVISIAMAMPARLPRRVRLCLRQADAVPRRAGAPNGPGIDRGVNTTPKRCGGGDGHVPHPRAGIWVGSRGRRRVCTWNISQPCPAAPSQVPSTTAGLLCPTATLGSGTAPCAGMSPWSQKPY